MNDLKERTQQIDTLLNEIITSDDATASAEKARTVYELVASEHLDEPVKASLAAFIKAAEQQRYNSTIRMEKLEKGKWIAWIVAIVFFALYVFIASRVPASNAAVAFSLVAATATWVAAFYQKRLADIEIELLRYQLRTTEVTRPTFSSHLES